MALVPEAALVIQFPRIGGGGLVEVRQTLRPKRLRNAIDALKSCGKTFATLKPMAARRTLTAKIRDHCRDQPSIQTRRPGSVCAR